MPSDPVPTKGFLNHSAVTGWTVFRFHGARGGGPKGTVRRLGIKSKDQTMDNIPKRADSSVEFHEGEERQRHDQHDDCDHQYSLSVPPPTLGML
jgi:hypothetical protein